MLKRSIQSKLDKALKRSPVVLLNGARQVGKTTLVEQYLHDGKYSYITFDDEITYLTALKNSAGFIADIAKPIILDEVQRVPEIFRPIKMDVHKNRHPGRYLLTGSANPLLIPALSESLAGRMEVIDLMPLSQGEIYGIQEEFIDTIFSKESFRSPQNSLSKEELYKRILIGGYPSVQNKNEEDREQWMRNYINLLLQKDIKDLAQIEKLTEFPNLLKILASRVTGTLNISDMATESKINGPTLKRYLSLLEALFIVYTQLPWSNNFTTRFVKSPKIYLLDTGLLTYLLNMNLERAMNDGPLMGRVLENFVVSELRKQATWSTLSVELYHMRIGNQYEIDIIIENRAGEIIGIEIKNSSRPSHNDFKSLHFLKEKIGKKFLKGIVLYTGDTHYPFGDNMHALPINSLWENIGHQNTI